MFCLRYLLSSLSHDEIKNSDLIAVKCFYGETDFTLQCTTILRSTLTQRPPRSNFILCTENLLFVECLVSMSMIFFCLNFLLIYLLSSGRQKTSSLNLYCESQNITIRRSIKKRNKFYGLDYIFSCFSDFFHCHGLYLEQ